MVGWGGGGRRRRGGRGGEVEGGEDKGVGMGVRYGEVVGGVQDKEGV